LDRAARSLHTFDFARQGDHDDSPPDGRHLAEHAPTGTDEHERQISQRRKSPIDVIDAIRTRRSIRAYLPRTVPRALIEQVILDAAQAPPAFRGQEACTFNVLEDAGRITTYGEEALGYARKHHPNEPGWEWTERAGFQAFWRAPVVIILSGRPD
jgi:hypothetical protein